MSILRSLRRRRATREDHLTTQPAAALRADESRLREAGDRILRAAIAACEPEECTRRAMASVAADLSTVAPVRLAAAGRHALAMARGAAEALEGRLDGGIAVSSERNGWAPDGVEWIPGDWPLPDALSVKAGRALRREAAEASGGALLLLVSPGFGGAIAGLPDGVGVSDLSRGLAALLDAGATRREVETVRRHWDPLHGGGIVRDAAGARIIEVALCDRPREGSDESEGSLVSVEPSRWAAVEAVLKRRGVWGALPLALRGLIERGLAGECDKTPRSAEPSRAAVRRIVAAGVPSACAAAQDEASRLGFHAQVLTTALVGDPREAGWLLGDMARALSERRGEGRPPQCVISGGRTAPTAGAPGTRNTTLALAAALALDGIPSALIASMDTDGADGGAPWGGAVATGTTAQLARERGLDPETAFRDGKAAELFEALTDRIECGPTGTDVGDLQVLLVG